MRHLNAKFDKAALVAALLALVLGFSGSVIGQAYQTQGLLVYVDANNPASYNPTSSPTAWNDLSGNNRNGVITGAPTLSNESLVFANSVISSDPSAVYVDMGTGFSDFGTGITIEVEAHFGTDIGSFERIFDFGNGQQLDNFWLGRYWNTDEIVLEVWHGNVAKGRCRTADEVNAIPASTTLKKFTFTLDGTKCRIYIDGVEQNTAISTTPPAFLTFTDDPSTLSSPYAFVPNPVERTKNYLGKSNWGGDAAFEGAVKYLRIYSAVLNEQSVLNNSQTSSASYMLTYSTAGADSGSAPTSFVGSGSITLSASPGTLAKADHEFIGWASSANQSSALPESFQLTQDVTLYPVFRPLVSDPPAPPASPPAPLMPEILGGGEELEELDPVEPGELFELQGEGLDLVQQVQVGEEKALIQSKTPKSLKFKIPRGLPAGNYDLRLFGDFGTVTEPGFFTVAKQKLKHKVFGFYGNSALLIRPLAFSIEKFLPDLPGAVRLVCVGSTSNTVATSFDVKLATQRARQACSFAKSQDPTLKTEIRINPASGLGPKARSVRLILKNY